MDKCVPGCRRPTPWGCFSPTLSFPRCSGSADSTVPGSWGCLPQAGVQIQRAFCSWEGRERCTHITAVQHKWGGNLHGGQPEYPHGPAHESPSLKATGGRYQRRRTPLGWAHWDLEGGGSLVNLTQWPLLSGVSW